MPPRKIVTRSEFVSGCNFGTSVRVLQLTANPSRCVSSAAHGSVAQHYSESSTATIGSQACRMAFMVGI